MSQDLATQNPAVRDWSSSEAAEALSETLVDAQTSPPLRVGDAVLDLRSGDWDSTFRAASIVGRSGRVVGLEEHPAALAAARRAAAVLAERLGYANVEFLRGRIDDLALDPDLLDAWLEAHPVRSAGEMMQLAREIARLRREEPLVPDRSFDAVITGFDAHQAAAVKQRAIAQEISRVLRPGGRVVCWDGDGSTS